MTKKRILMLIGSVGLALMLALPLALGCAAPAPSPTPTPSPTPSPAPAEIINWVAQSGYTPGDPIWDVSQVVVDKINAMSNGQLVIDLFPGGAVTPAWEEWDGLRTGTLDLAFGGGAMAMNLIPWGGFFSGLPGGLTSMELKYWYRVGGGDEIAEEAHVPFNIKYVGSILLAPEDFAYTTIPLKTVADLSKLKMRTAGHGGIILSNMGVAVVSLPGSEIYESMQRGVINAFEYISASGGWQMGFQEVIDYLYISYSRAPADILHVAAYTDSFEALSPYLQEIVQVAVYGAMDSFYQEAMVEDGKALEKMKDYGVQVLALPKEIEDAFIEEAKKYLAEQVAENPDAAPIIESQLAFQEMLVKYGVT